MTRKRSLALAAILLVLGAVIALFPAYQTSALVRWHAHRLRSTNPNERAAARLALLGMGRPTIDRVFPDLVAQEIHEEATNTDVVVIVGRRLSESAEAIARVASGDRLRRYEVLETLAGAPPAAPATKEPLVASGPLVCPTAQKLWSDSAAVELAVLARKKDGTLDLRVAVPLADEDRAAIVAAVRARLAAP